MNTRSRSRSQFASEYACDDLRKLDDAGTAALRAASLRHQVIYIRGQSRSYLSPQLLKALRNPRAQGDQEARARALGQRQLEILMMEL